MPHKIEVFEYTFSDLVMIAKRPSNRAYSVWYLRCPECEQEHQFRKLGRKIWIAHCTKYDVEWTVTPAEYYEKRPADFSLILGHTE